MDAELELGRKPIASDGLGDDRQVVVELPLELRHVTHVVHALVEAAGEFGRDGLNGYAGIGQRGQDDQQRGWRLRGVGLVHGHLGDEASDTLRRGDVAVQRPGFLSGLEELGGDATDVVGRGHQRLGDPRDDLGSDQLRMAIQEGLHRLGGRGLSDEVGDVDRVEVAVRQEAPHRFQADVIGIQEVRGLPAEGFHSRIGGGPGCGRLGADDGVLAVRLVPDGDHLHALRQGELAGLQLGLRLVGESVADADGKAAEDQGLAHGLFRSLTARPSRRPTFLRPRCGRFSR